MMKAVPYAKEVFCMGLKNALGITQVPEFSFFPTGDFTAVRIQCENQEGEIFWDKTFQSENTFGFFYDGRPLADGEKVTYRIGLYNGEHFGGFSDNSWFEMGIQPENFQKKMI